MGSCHSGGLHETSLESLATILMRQNKAQCLSSTLPPRPRQYGTPTVPLLHDVWFEVLLFLHPSTVAKVFRVCSVLRDFCEEQALWRAFILRDGENVTKLRVFKVLELVGVAVTNPPSLSLKEGVEDITIPLVLLVHVETSFVMSLSFSPQDEIKSMQTLLSTSAAHITNLTMDYYWLYRVRWSVRNWGLPAKSVVFEPWPETLQLVTERETLVTRNVDSDHPGPSLTVTRITLGRCCHPHSCLTISTEEEVNGTVHQRTFHTKFYDQEAFHEWYLNLAVRSAQCPLREPLCIHPKDPYAKDLSEEALEVCRTHAILPRDFCRLRDALKREVQLVRDAHSFLTGNLSAGPLMMCEDGVRYHGRTLGLQLDFVQAAYLWRAYVKLGLIYHDKPTYSFLLSPTN